MKSHFADIRRRGRLPEGQSRRDLGKILTMSKSMSRRQSEISYSASAKPTASANSKRKKQKQSANQ